MESARLENIEMPRSRLFLVRLWREQLDGDTTEWRGQVLAPLTGQELYFRGWDGLVTVLEKMLELLDSPPKQEPSVDESL